MTSVHSWGFLDCLRLPPPTPVRNLSPWAAWWQKGRSRGVQQTQVTLCLWNTRSVSVFSVAVAKCLRVSIYKEESLHSSQYRRLKVQVQAPSPTIDSASPEGLTVGGTVAGPEAGEEGGQSHSFPNDLLAALLMTSPSSSNVTTLGPHFPHRSLWGHPLKPHPNPGTWQLHHLLKLQFPHLQSKG